MGVLGLLALVMFFVGVKTTSSNPEVIFFLYVPQMIVGLLWIVCSIFYAFILMLGYNIQVLGKVSLWCLLLVFINSIFFIEIVVPSERTLFFETIANIGFVAHVLTIFIPVTKPSND